MQKDEDDVPLVFDDIWQSLTELTAPTGADTPDEETCDEQHATEPAAAVCGDDAPTQPIPVCKDDPADTAELPIIPYEDEEKPALLPSGSVLTRFTEFLAGEHYTEGGMTVVCRDGFTFQVDADGIGYYNPTNRRILSWRTKPHKVEPDFFEKLHVCRPSGPIEDHRWEMHRGKDADYWEEMEYYELPVAWVTQLILQHGGEDPHG